MSLYFKGEGGMEYKKMGRAGLKVSVISLGCLEFGRKVSETTAIELINNALAAGVNFIDTADIYGKEGFNSPSRGASEEVVGKALKGRRNSVVLATKLEGKIGPGPNDRGLSRKHTMNDVEESLRRLQTDYVDIYYAHSPDYSTPLEETLRAFDDLVHQGKVLYIGMSNFFAWQICKALWISDKNNLARCDCIQTVYNLISRDGEIELLHLCESEGVGVNVWAPLAGGMLTGKYSQLDPNQPPPAGARAYPNTWKPSNFEAVARLKEIAEGHGKSLAQFSLAWLLQNPVVTSVVCGASSVRQLEENLGATQVKLSAEELTACDEVWQTLRPKPSMFYARGYGFT
jgi:aryl-alcohol dehydrogenase-like predicted oxidoreductase